MTAGKLAAAKPAATTNTKLYNCPINKATSSVLEVCNQGGSASSYRVALRDYDQILTLDSSSYSLQKGNVITDYSITISPGISVDQVDPGDTVKIDNSSSSFKYHDIFKPTSTITYDVKIASIASVIIDNTSQVGTFSVGDTVTGAVTGLTGTIYSVSDNQLYLNIAPILTAATSFYVNTNTGITANDYIYVGGEIVLVNSITGYNVAVTRAQIGTTAGDHLAGSPFTALRSTATTTTINEGATYGSTDVTLTVTSAASFNVGDYIRIDNEIITITQISGNDLTVTRGSFGTTPATHNNGATVTLYDEVVTGYAQFFALTEEIDNGSGATVDLNVTAGPLGVFSPLNKFVFDFGSGDYEFRTTIPIDGDRIVRFTQSDSSNASNTLRFSLVPDGTNSGGTEYTTGVTFNGTAGSSGAYTEIDLLIEDLGVTNQIYIYSSSTPQILSGGYISVDLTPNYPTMYLYDLQGPIAVNDTFSINNVNYTVTAVSSGPYGYVQDKSTTKVKVSLGTGSASFAGTDTFYDSPIVPGATRTLATVSSVSDINDEDYFVYGKSINANTTDRITGVVVGPGHSLLVYSGANTISYVVHGFEDATSDFTPVYYYRQSTTAPQ